MEGSLPLLDRICLFLFVVVEKESGGIVSIELCQHAMIFMGC